MMFGLVGVAVVAPATLPAQRTLRVDLRVAVDEGSEDPVGHLRDFAVARDGRIYVLDQKPKRILIFGADGQFDRAISRVGSGPGEIRDANGILAAPDGTVRVRDHGNSRLSIFGPAGAYLRQVRFDAKFHGWRWDGAFDARRRLVSQVYIPDATQQLYAWQLRDLGGKIVDTIAIAPDERAERRGGEFYQAEWGKGRRIVASYPFRAPVTPAFDPQGAVWSVAGDDYHLARVTLVGDTTARARRDVEAYPVPDAVRDSGIAQIRERIKGSSKNDVDFSRVPQTYQFVSQLVIDGQRRLWARRESPRKGITEFDVFDGRGTFLFTAQLNERLDHYGRLLFVGDALYGVALDQDDLPTIIRARLAPQ